MKKIIIVHSCLDLGGAESSLIGLLQNIDYQTCSVDLLLLNPCGELMPFVPPQVHILETPPAYRHLMVPVKQVIRAMDFGVVAARLYGKLRGKHAQDITYATKLYSHYAAMRFLPDIPGEYDLAISFIDPHWIVQRKVSAKNMLGWVHFQFSERGKCASLDRRMWGGCNRIVHVSEACKQRFDEVYPDLSTKTTVLENLLDDALIGQRAKEFTLENEMPMDGSIRLLSIGRYCNAKNFDSVPDICRRIRQKGLDIKWYLIGFGSDEYLIRQKIAEAEMESYVILLGKKENPYPYILACDLYVQPSRSEGKCVAVREAQLLHKPVVITAYATANSQLDHGIDGVIVPMDNEGCAAGIATLLRDQELIRKIVVNTHERDYTNSKVIEQLYRIMDDDYEN